MPLEDWRKHGFAAEPQHKTAPSDGLIMYRAWGSRSKEIGTGYFSLEKPKSVLDAELRFNIADWGNAVHFVSTFRLLPGYGYYVGPVAHGPQDLSTPAHQIYLELPRTKVELVLSRELLPHDVTVVQRPGRA